MLKRMEEARRHALVRQHGPFETYCAAANQQLRQFGHDYSLMRKCRAYFAESAKRVREGYSDANLELANVGVTV